MLSVIIPAYNEELTVDRAYYTIMQYERYSMILIIFLSLSGMLDTIIGNGVGLLYNGIASAISALLNLILGWNLG